MPPALLRERPPVLSSWVPMTRCSGPLPAACTEPRAPSISESPYMSGPLSTELTGPSVGAPLAVCRKWIATHLDDLLWNVGDSEAVEAHALWEDAGQDSSV